MKFEINKLISIKFQPNNGIKYYQDRRFHNNIPNNVNFYPIKIDSGFLDIIGNEHGIMKKHLQFLDGSYGNGSISIPLSEFDKSEMEKLEIIVDKNKMIFGL